MKLRAALLAALTTLITMGTAEAGPGRDRLDAFLQGLGSLEADFRQILVGADGQAADESSGRVYLERPGRFRWDYQVPYPQLIVADGTTVWLYDPDLAQVTRRPQGRALGSTPAALLASDRPVEESFTITELPARDDGTTWLALTPRDEQASFEGIRIGFDDEGLTAMELQDGFGQTTRLEFSAIRRNPELAASLFRFTPPEGVDVIEGQ